MLSSSLSPLSLKSRFLRSRPFARARILKLALGQVKLSLNDTINISGLDFFPAYMLFQGYNCFLLTQVYATKKVSSLQFSCIPWLRIALLIVNPIAESPW